MDYKAPTYAASMEANEELWSEVMPGLWQGGTHWSDEIGFGRREAPAITADDFDLVVTMYADANPVDWFVEEIRLGVMDGPIEVVDLPRILRAAKHAHQSWKNGDRVLIRCQAGWNRSGLVTALVLILDGMPATEAIDLIRERRSPQALCNRSFANWLVEHGASAVLDLTPAI